MAAIFAFHAGKAVVQIVADIAIDHPLDIGPPESVMHGEMLVIDLDKGFKIVLYAVVIIRVLRAARPVNAGGQWYVKIWRAQKEKAEESDVAIFDCQRIGRQPDGLQVGDGPSAGDACGPSP